MPKNFYTCRNCLNLFPAENLTITEYITLELRKEYMVVCQACLEELTDMGVIPNDEERIVAEQCVKFGIDP